MLLAASCLEWFPSGKDPLCERPPPPPAIPLVALLDGCEEAAAADAAALALEALPPPPPLEAWLPPPRSWVDRESSRSMLPRPRPCPFVFLWRGIG